MKELTYPNGHFTVQEVSALNSLPLAQTHYAVRRAMANGKLTKVETQRGSVGRPKNVFTVNTAVVA